MKSSKVFIQFLFVQVVLSGFTIRQDCNCGIINEDRRRIINGHPTHPNKYPWMAALLVLPKHSLLCGGSLISDRHILTAGHCYLQRSEDEMMHHSYWILGSHKYREANTRLQMREVKFHEDFHRSREIGEYFDLALVTLQEKVTFSREILPICLPSRDAQFNDHEGLFAGWGRTEHDGPPEVLMDTQMDVFPFDNCRQQWNSATGLTLSDKWTICAFKHDTDVCYGDSGGPLMVLSNRRYYAVAGVASFGTGCTYELPTVFARVSKETVITWLVEEMIKSETEVCQRKKLPIIDIVYARG